ncbi:hypothetical protein RJ640_017889 [Escallonia rubra]|uniref:ALOG domain-containing protein n=1 Tax=Escallonia rubra TaxID=112253 RepID=A0AA88U5N1_9ASTE|nr:hypothetical protein RJ640_017889 [Escallonia rubra]
MGYNTRQGKQHQLDEHVSLMEAQFADHFGAIHDQLIGLNETVSGISDLRSSVDQLKDELPVVRQSLKELQQMMHQLIHLKDGESSGSGLRQSKTGKGYEQPNQEYHYNTAHTPSPKLPKIEFPRFCGEDSYGWNFGMGTYIKARGRVSWFTFVKDLHARFSSLFRESVIGEFHKLRQTNTVEQYYNDFETLRSILVSEGSKFEEDYFLQSFISGLKDDIRLEVEKFDVDDLSRAIYLARKQEASLNNVWHHPRTMTRTQPAPNNPSLIKSQTSNSNWKARPVSILVVDEEEDEDTLPIYDEEFALEKTTVEKEEDRKRRDWNTFGQYLRNHRPQLSLARYSGAHVLEFLHYLDQFGKTKAWGSLDALIDCLCTAFEENGGKPESNPFGPRAVRLYLRKIREEEAKNGGSATRRKSGSGRLSCNSRNNLLSCSLRVEDLDFLEIRVLACESGYSKGALNGESFESASPFLNFEEGHHDT